MKYRKSILTALDILISESSRNVTEDMKKLKTDAWHIGLEDIPDDQIGRGMVEAIKLNNGFLVSCGQFRTICLDTHKRFRKNELEKQKVLEYNNPVEPEPVRGQITYAEWKELFIVEEK